MRIRSIFLCLGVIGTAWWGCSAPAQQPEVRVTRPSGERPGDAMKYKLLPLGRMNYSTVDQVCRPWLSEGGIMTHEAQRESILVYDRAEVITRIAKFLADVRGETYNIRVTVDYAGVSGDTETRFNIHDRQHPRRIPFRIDDGHLKKPDHAVVQANVRRDAGTSLNSMSLMTGDGLPASLWSGTTQIDPSWLNAQVLVPEIVVMVPGNVFVVPQPDVDFKWAEVGAKLMVCPTYQPATDTVTVELYPRLSWIEGRTKKEQAVKVQTLTTKVTVKPGQRVQIGSVLENKRDGYVNLFGPDFFRSGSGFSATDIYLKCEVLKPGDPRSARRSAIPVTPGRRVKR